MKQILLVHYRTRGIVQEILYMQCHIHSPFLTIGHDIQERAAFCAALSGGFSYITLQSWVLHTHPSRQRSRPPRRFP